MIGMLGLIINIDICPQLSIDIGTEVKYQNKMLDDMVSHHFLLWINGTKGGCRIIKCRNADVNNCIRPFCNLSS